ncbi:MAG: hypothetical protein HY304_01540 [candidate division Zixibacteria bacterium]|nr:hypothetical protein [candidate division Zixibacteria bacterium]
MPSETGSLERRSPASEIEGGGAVVAEEESPYRHHVPGQRPRTDGAFFELLLLLLAQERGPLPDFEAQWPRAMQALAGMNVLGLSGFSEREMTEALATVGGEFHSRLADKAKSLIQWAEAFWHVHQIYGSFRQYVRSFDNDGFEALMADLRQRLAGLTTEFLTGYLREAGERTPGAPEKDRPAARSVESGRSSGGGQSRSAEGQRGRDRQDRGRRRPQTRVQAPKSQAAAPSTPPKPEARDGQADQGQGRNRRNRRRFFRRKRGDGGRGPQSTAPSSTS